MNERQPIVGFVSPPAWYDPSPTEFFYLMSGKVLVQQYIFPQPDFDYELRSIAATEPDQILAARSLSATGCVVVATVGTPFCWAGLDSVSEARARCDRLSAASGVPNIMAGLSVIDGLMALGARRVGLACTYYSDDWRHRWANFVSKSGLEVIATNSFSAEEMVSADESGSRAHWAPEPAMIAESVMRLAYRNPGLDAIAISGAGSRTLAIASDLEARLRLPVLGSDTALYWSIARQLRLTIGHAAIGKIALL